MTERSSLFSQPAAFWLGAYMVAEAPVLVAVSLLDPATQARLWEMLLSGPLAIGGALVGAVGSGLVVGWIAHRLGLGR